MNVESVKQGAIIAGKYRIDRVLGKGGMGIVVAATHLELLEPRALKFMLPTALSNAEAVERFLREARAAARLKSEHVAKVYDVGRLDDGAPYMVMEYLEGHDLNALIKRRGPLPPALAALYMVQACKALVQAHAADIVHRDLKPANLFLTHRTDGSPCIKVLDFGISKFMGAASPGAEFDVTKTHEVLGSPSYMSPEQLRSAKNVDSRSDIWSLGVILYKLVTGVAPFRGENITELIANVLIGKLKPVSQIRPGIPPAFDEVILGCLRPDRADRYPSATALTAALEPFLPRSGGPTLRIASVSGDPEFARPPLENKIVPTAVRSVGPEEERTGSSWAKTLASNSSMTRLFVGLAMMAGAGVILLTIRIAFPHRADPVGEAPLPSAEQAAGTSLPPPVTGNEAPTVDLASVTPAVASVASSASMTAPPPISQNAPGAPLARKPPPQSFKRSPTKAADPFGDGRL